MHCVAGIYCEGFSADRTNMTAAAGPVEPAAQNGDTSTSGQDQVRKFASHRFFSGAEPFCAAALLLADAGLPLHKGRLSVWLCSTLHRGT